MLHFYSRYSTFIVGFILGVLLATTYKKFTQNSTKHPKSFYENWFSSQGLIRQSMLWDTYRYGNKTTLSEANYLFKKITVLCVILVQNENNAVAANSTWAQSCNSIQWIYLRNKINKRLPAKRTKETSSWILLCNKLQNLQNNFEWLLVVNDYTFVILENLRYYTASLDADKPYYLGHTVEFWSTRYNTGEAGYVLSRGAWKALKETLNDCAAPTAYWNREDFYLGKQLAHLNVTPSDTRDLEGLSTFFPYNWYHVFFPGENYYKTSFYPTKCCSKRAVTFKATEGDKMYTYYYILYTLQLFMGGNLGNKPPKLLQVEDEVWKQFLRERNEPIEGISSEKYYKLWEELIADPMSFAKNMKKEYHFDYD